MPWVFRRRVVGTDGPQVRISCPAEVLRPVREGPWWVVRCSTLPGARAVGACGWDLVERWEPHPPGPPVPEVAPTAFRDALEVLRRGGHDPAPPAEDPDDLGDLVVVLVVSLWDRRHAMAVLGALKVVSAMGRGSHVVLVQNGAEPVKRATREWRQGVTSSRLRTVYCRNDGFAHACAAGTAAARPHPEGRPQALLFTQADVDWGWEAAREGLLLLRQLQASEGTPPVVGPSGGFVSDDGESVREWGANGAPTGQRPRWVDWIAGFWLLIDRGLYSRLHGWDAGSYFLYWEDPDLCLQAALEGARCVAWPTLAVRHERRHTINRMWSGSQREAYRRESQENFVSKWIR